MREKILMFITYIEFFHKMHSKYLKRFSNKIQLMYTHINNDIHFDDSVEISKNKKKELIEFINSRLVDYQFHEEDAYALAAYIVDYPKDPNSKVESLKLKYITKSSMMQPG